MENWGCAKLYRELLAFRCKTEVGFLDSDNYKHTFTYTKFRKFQLCGRGGGDGGLLHTNKTPGLINWYVGKTSLGLQFGSMVLVCDFLTVLYWACNIMAYHGWNIQSRRPAHLKVDRKQRKGQGSNLNFEVTFYWPNFLLLDPTS